MTGVDAFRDPQLAAGILAHIERTVAESDRTFTFMEVCGTHTMVIYQHGLRALLPGNIRLVSGPGCPVCVTPVAYVDHAISLARQPDITLCTFGDMMRVPGSAGSLLEEKARGRDIRILYSALDAVGLARSNPERQIVFLGVGFETTAPTVAAAILQAYRENLNNFSILCTHKTMPAPMEALTADPELQIDGYLCPAHVSTVIGVDGYRNLAEKYAVPCVITGFEPLDILQGIVMLTRQIRNGEATIENQYSRFVKAEGNPRARQLLSDIFEPCDTIWRGLGTISGSGLRLREEFRHFDAAHRFRVEVVTTGEPAGCRCGDILKGKLSPRECPLFGQRCTPETPVGACMVSSEGSCAADYKYGI